MHRALRLLLLVSAFAGCPRTPQEPDCVIGQRAPEGILVPGEPALVTLGLEERCANSAFSGAVIDHPIHKADDVVIEVLDPNNQPAPFTASGPMRTSGIWDFDTLVEVTFTPTFPGTWTIKARFEPGIGLTQQALEVVQVRTDAGQRVVPVALPADCRDYGVTGQGTPLCVRPLPSGQFELLAGTQRWEGVGFAIDSDAIWKLTSTPSAGAVDWAIERLAEDAGTLGPTHRIQSLSKQNPAFAARDGDLWLFTHAGGGGALFQQHPEPDGGFSARATHSVLDVQIEAVVVGDGRVLLGGASQSQAIVVSAALDGGGSSRIPKGTVFGNANIVQADEETIWLRSAPFPGAVLTAIGADLRQTSMDLRGLNDLPRTGLNPSSPVLPLAIVSRGVPIPAHEQRLGVARFDGTAITFERFDTGADYFQVTSANRTHAFARSRDGKSLKIFER